MNRDMTVDYTDLLGCKFKIHGRNKEDGFDCYGLAIEVLRRNGIIMPDLWYDDSVFKQREKIHEIASHTFLHRIEKLELNCIIEMNVQGLPRHIGVYIGNGMMIHSMYKVGVVIVPISKYKHSIVGYSKVCNT